MSRHTFRSVYRWRFSHTPSRSPRPRRRVWEKPWDAPDSAATNDRETPNPKKRNGPRFLERREKGRGMEEGVYPWRAEKRRRFKGALYPPHRQLRAGSVQGWADRRSLSIANEHPWSPLKQTLLDLPRVALPRPELKAACQPFHQGRECHLRPEAGRSTSGHLAPCTPAIRATPGPSASSLRSSLLTRSLQVLRCQM